MRLFRKRRLPYEPEKALELWKVGLVSLNHARAMSWSEPLEDGDYYFGDRPSMFEYPNDWVNAYNSKLKGENR